MKYPTKNIVFLFSGIFFAIFVCFPVVKVLADTLDVSATVPAICGNGVMEGDEACDDGNVVNGDGCSAVCAVEVAAVCGNGVMEGAEACDDGNVVNGDGCSAVCAVEVNGGGNGGVAPRCGDGRVNGNDECDDGNFNDLDACSNLCKIAICGDGIVNGNDECDDNNGNNDDLCSNLCKIPVCGDGQMQGAEQCDDGNALDNDGCSQVCIVEPRPICGNAIREGLEQCDDGNNFDHDGCSAACLLDPAPVCGNGRREFNEFCDDGNNLDHDGCNAQCFEERMPRCGNRMVEFGEQCDDGNLADGDGCSIACQLEPAPVCGNGRKERGEVCDDGNLRNNDGCNNRCQFVPLPGTVCGNGIKEVGEQCDDGNLHGGDGCSGACQRENPVNIPPIINNPQNQNPNNQNQPVDNIPVVDQVPIENVEVAMATSSPQKEKNKIDVLPAASSSTSLLLGVKKDAALTQNIAQIAKNIWTEVKVLNQLADSPKVEELTKTVVAPVTAAVVAATLIPSLFNIIIPLLRFLFLQPILLFGRKKRQAWGQVYNTLTKLPVDLAMVRLVDTKTKRVLQSRVTDAAGRYFFITEPGEYTLEVVKPGFSFPSKLLQSVKTDGSLVDIYHGELVQVTESGVGITPNIPLDPIDAEETPRRIIWEKRWRIVQHIISVLGIISTAISLYIIPVWYMWLFLGLHILVYLGFMRFVNPKKPKGWGLVYEKQTAMPVNNTIVRLFTKQYNKLVSTQITDKKGRYAFLVGPSEYYVTYEKKGYKPEKTADIIISPKEDVALLKQNISLEKEN